MKTLNKLMLLFFALFMFIPKGYSQNNSDPGIGILMSPSSLQQGSTGTLSATVGNYGNGTIVQNSLRVTISVGANAEILGIASGSDTRWNQLSLTTGSGNTIKLTNSGGSFSTFDVGDILLTVRGNVVSVANGIAGNIVYITANNPLLCGGCSSPPLNASQGNASNSNDNSETSVVVTAASSPSIKITKDGSYVDNNADGITSVGDTVVYTFVVTNTGNVPLTNITVTDNNATVTGGPIATLAVGAIDSTTFTAIHTITQSDINAGLVYNLATTTGTPPSGPPVIGTSTDPTPCTTCPTNSSCPTCTITPLSSSPSIKITKDGSYVDNNADGITSIGDTVVYTFVVTNTGNVPLTNITVTDNNATVTGGPIATLAVGAIDSTTFTAIHTITQSDINAGLVYNLATTTGTPPSGPPVIGTSTDPTPCTTCPTNSSCPTCTITPLIPVIIANDDVGNSVVGINGGIAYTNVLVNDTLNGQPIIASQVNITLVSSTNANITLSGTNVIVASGTLTGNYLLVYQICEILNPNNCDTATVTIPVVCPPSPQPTLACYETATFNTTTCRWDVTGTQPTEPAHANCWDTYSFDTATCAWVNNNTPQPTEPAHANCWDTYSFDTATCAWVNNNTPQPVIPTLLCYQTASWNATTCQYDVTGVQPLPQTTSIVSQCNGDDSISLDIQNLLNTQFPGVIIATGTWSISPSTTGLNTNTGTFTPLNVPVGSYLVSYQNNDPNCPKTVNITIPIDDSCIVQPCATLDIHNAITPNGDGMNEFFEIDNITDACYSDNTVEIYNRWGIMVFNTTNYDNSTKVFRGISEGRFTIKQSAELPNGTYFYILKYKTSIGNYTTKNGYLYLSR